MTARWTAVPPVHQVFVPRMARGVRIPFDPASVVIRDVGEGWVVSWLASADPLQLDETAADLLGDLGEQVRDRVPRTRTGALDWATFLAGLWAYATVAVVAGLVIVLVALGLGRLARR